VLVSLFVASLGGRAIYARLTAPAPCGEAYVNVQGAVSQVPGGATACFLQAASLCVHKTITVQIAGGDGYTEQELIVEPRDRGCVITDSWTGHGTFSVIPPNHDYACAGVVQDSPALQLEGCPPNLPFDPNRPIVPAVAALSAGHHVMK